MVRRPPRSTRTDTLFPYTTLFRSQIAALLDAQKYREYEKPLNSDSSFWGGVAGWARATFQDEEDYREYIAMLRDMPRYFDQQMVNMRAGLKRGRSEEHTSELQSLMRISYAVFCLKKKNKTKSITTNEHT